MEFEKHDVEITDDFRKMYDAAVDLWAAIDVAFVGAREDGVIEGRQYKTVRTQQFGACALDSIVLTANAQMRTSHLHVMHLKLRCQQRRCGHPFFASCYTVRRV